MKRTSSFRVNLAFVMVACYWAMPTVGYAQTWAERMFSELDHNFGNVPRGSDVRCEFVIRNRYNVPVRISGMKRTCGCTDVQLDDQTVLSQQVTEKSLERVLEPLAETRIKITLDTRNFVQEKSTEITVFFDRPRKESVRLTVRSFIRQDVVLNPGAIQFGAGTRAELKAKQLKIEYAGKLDWRIRGVSVHNPALKVSYQEAYRKRGEVGYLLKVDLAEKAPKGILRDTIILHTNDPASPQVAVLVDGKIRSDLVVTPAQLRFGVVRSDQGVTKRVLLRSKTPFKITSVEGADPTFDVDFSETVRKIHTITLKLKPGSDPGELAKRLRVVTDLPNEPPAEFQASATLLR